VVNLTGSYVFTLLSDCGKIVTLFHFQSSTTHNFVFSSSLIPSKYFPYPLKNLLKEVIYGYVDKIDIIIMHSPGKAESSGDYP